MLPLSLRPHLRASALYLVFTLLLGLATVRALVIAAPRFAANLTAERHVGECRERQRELTVQALIDGDLAPELKRAETRTYQAEQALGVASQDSLGSLLPFFAFVALLAVVLNAYGEDALLATTIAYGSGWLFLGTLAAYHWAAICGKVAGAWHLAGDVLTLPEYRHPLAFSVLTLVGLALAYDLRQRRQATAQPLAGRLLRGLLLVEGGPEQPNEAPPEDEQTPRHNGGQQLRNHGQIFNQYPG